MSRDIYDPHHILKFDLGDTKEPSTPKTTTPGRFPLRSRFGILGMLVEFPLILILLAGIIILTIPILMLTSIRKGFIVGLNWVDKKATIKFKPSSININKH